MKIWLGFFIFVCGMWVYQHVTKTRYVETNAARWTIEGPFAPGEMPADLQAQWDNLKQTGIGPGHPDF